MDSNEINCPPVVIEYVQSVDLTSSDNSNVFSWIASNSTLACQIESLSTVADRLNAISHTQVIDDFCASAATYSRFLDETAKEKIKQAYIRIPYDKSIALNYFNGLRYNSIDIRPFLFVHMQQDWSFKHPRQNAETWHYFLYLASLDEEGAYDAIEKKLDSTLDGNDATNLIVSLADLKTEQTKHILLKFAKDMRHADGPEGPELTIAETVKILLNSDFQ
jgi:hypothetical protein